MFVVTSLKNNNKHFFDSIKMLTFDKIKVAKEQFHGPKTKQ